jgi:hypothetical protein
MMHDQYDSCNCGVCKGHPYERNNYFHGKTLSARDLTAEQRYFNEKRWLVNRAVIGWGIVCGLRVEMEDGTLVVHPGLALDCCGHEILVCECEKIDPCRLADELHIDRCSNSEPVRWALCLEYRECKMEPVSLPPSCDQKERGREHNRIREGYRLSVRLWNDACPENHDDSCCMHRRLGVETSIHGAFLKKSEKCPECKKCDCVFLAGGTLKTYANETPRIILDEEAWKYRRVVYTNRALGGMLHCLHGGLAHIVKISWTHDTLDVGAFLDLLRREPLAVTFDKPMDERAVTNPRTCRLSIYIASDEESCPAQLLIPVKRIEYADRVATYYFNDDCVQDHLRRRCRTLKKPAEVELVLHGSMMLDKNSRALDAELIDGFPTGNGVEAGEFIKYFSVVP